MARAKGTNVLNTTVRGHQHEDGYVLLAGDGYTVLANTLSVDSVIFSFTHTGTGLWTATLKECYFANLFYFNVVPQLHSTDTPSVVFFQLLNDNVGTTGTTVGTGSNPQVINWKFCNSSGTAIDLPAHAGWKYEIGLSWSSAYVVKAY